MHQITLGTLLADKDLARLLNCSVSTLRRNRLLRRGCPWVKMEGSVRYRIEDVQEYLNSCLVRR